MERHTQVVFIYFFDENSTRKYYRFLKANEIFFFLNPFILIQTKRDASSRLRVKITGEMFFYTYLTPLSMRVNLSEIIVVLQTSRRTTKKSGLTTAKIEALDLKLIESSWLILFFALGFKQHFCPFEICYLKFQ